MKAMVHEEGPDGRCLKCGRRWICQGWIDENSDPDPRTDYEQLLDAGYDGWVTP